MAAEDKSMDIQRDQVSAARTLLASLNSAREDDGGGGEPTKAEVREAKRIVAEASETAAAVTGGRTVMTSATPLRTKRGMAGEEAAAAAAAAAATLPRSAQTAPGGAQMVGHEGVATAATTTSGARGARTEKRGEETETMTTGGACTVGEREPPPSMPGTMGTPGGGAAPQTKKVGGKSANNEGTYILHPFSLRHQYFVCLFVCSEEVQSRALKGTKN